MLTLEIVDLLVLFGYGATLCPEEYHTFEIVDEPLFLCLFRVRIYAQKSTTHLRLSMSLCFYVCLGFKFMPRRVPHIFEIVDEPLFLCLFRVQIYAQKSTTHLRLST